MRFCDDALSFIMIGCIVHASPWQQDKHVQQRRRHRGATCRLRRLVRSCYCPRRCVTDSIRTGILFEYTRFWYAFRHLLSPSICCYYGFRVFWRRVSSTTGILLIGQIFFLDRSYWSIFSGSFGWPRVTLDVASPRLFFFFSALDGFISPVLGRRSFFSSVDTILTLWSICVLHSLIHTCF